MKTGLSKIVAGRLNRIKAGWKSRKNSPDISTAKPR
jgi:hypothetical protein